VAGKAKGQAPEPAPIRVAVLGCGNVGGALVELLLRGGDEIAARTGVRLELAGVAVANPSRPRDVDVPPGMLTGDAAGLVTRPDVDVVVELIGGFEPTQSLMEQALRNKRPVVTANKALLAEHGGRLAEIAADQGVDLLYEAAVAGGIPLIRLLRESLAGERIVRVMGILNGTTNFILTRMSEEGTSYEAALAEAQQLGLAERDPTADVEGEDAAAKAAILAGLAFGADVPVADVYREGITRLRSSDVSFAAQRGYTVKLLAVVESGSPGEVGVRVHPALVPDTHPLASVRGAFNAVFVQGASAGELMLYGRGAGGEPTASAVLGDLIDAARNLQRQTASPHPAMAPTRVRPIDELRCPYYLSLDAYDRPGVLAVVAKVFGEHDVSIRSMEQVGMGEEARLTFLTHDAREGDVRATFGALDQLAEVESLGAMLRVMVPDTSSSDDPR
jgi:homoserine dehydrogenase